MKTSGTRYIEPGVTRSLGEERKIALVSGPRQVGKTTFSRHLLTGAGSPQMYFNWDVEEDRLLINRHPGDFWTRREPTSRSLPLMLVLDEIHKFPRWKRFLKEIGRAHV